MKISIERTTKRVTSAVLAVLMMVSIAACDKKEDGKVTITIANTPNETMVKELEDHNKKVAEFEELNPDIKIVSDSDAYADAKTFMLTAAAHQLPTAYTSHFTDTKLRIREGYAADITKLLEKYDLVEKINPDFKSLVCDDDGKIYGIPVNGYAQGLAVNKELFKKAGLVNADGTIKYPDSYEELAEFAVIIKEKTGVAGYAIPTISNCGGWHFMNIAWSYGVNFEEQQEDGSWKATFNTPEAVAALQFIKDLKWKYNVLPETSVIDQTELHKLYGTGQVAMIISGTNNSWSQKYGMDLSKIAICKIPKGPAGRYAQTGGSALQFSADATEAEIEAAFKWYDFSGSFPDLSEDRIAKIEKGRQLSRESNSLLLPCDVFPVWVDAERDKVLNEIYAKYANVDVKDYETYLDFSNVTLRAEETVCAQELYAVLDSAIQEVLANKDADCAAIIKTACNDFQVNHLDKQN